MRSLKETREGSVVFKYNRQTRKDWMKKKQDKEWLGIDDLQLTIDVTQTNEKGEHHETKESF
jgi:hypothetical protein